MIIRFLGTAAAEGIPGLHCTCELCREALTLGGKEIRRRSSVIIDEDLMIDFGPDIYWQKIEFGLALDKVRHAFITHAHEDHFAPCELFYRVEYFANNPPELRVFGNERVGEGLERALGRPELAFTRVAPGDVTDLPNGRVTALRGVHDRTQTCLIYLIERDGKAVLHGNDTGIFPEETFERLRGKHLDAVWLDCTHAAEKEGTNHMGIEDNLIVRDRLLEIGCADERTQFIATHFSHNGRLLHHQLVERLQPLGFQVAYDGMAIEL